MAAQTLEDPAPQLSPSQRLDWAVGRSFAHRPWVSAPATTKARDGLGPLFNARSCASCHPGNGQGKPPERGLGLILRLPEGPSPFGIQLQDQALPGFSPEGRIAWQPLHQAPKGLAYRRYFIAEYRQLQASARLAPMLIGMGRVNEVEPTAITDWEDPGDANGDGISGRAARLENGRIGRFGWKASQATLIEQIAQAFAEDLGIDSSSHSSAPCEELVFAPEQLPLCLRASGADSSDGAEIRKALLTAVEYYIANLALPNSSPSKGGESSGAGAALFAQAGCASCHRPSLPSATGKIWVYSDLLLHNMGEGLDDGVAEGAAASDEWRTAPLWGLGERSADPDNTYLLHDGRARSIRQAIAWHGGEAENAARAFSKLSAAQQDRLIEFLKEL